MAGSGNDSRVFEGALMGGVLLMALWGGIIVVADLVFGAELVPDSQAGAVVILLVLVAVGALIGAAVARAH